MPLYYFLILSLSITLNWWLFRSCIKLTFINSFYHHTSNSDLVKQLNSLGLPPLTSLRLSRLKIVEFLPEVKKELEKLKK